MAYTLELTKGAQRHFHDLETEVGDRVAAAFGALRTNPRTHGSIKLTGGQSLYRIRVGTHRIIYQIDDRNRQVLVLKILHRREAYR